MPSSLALWDDLNGLHGRRRCIQKQVLCGFLYLALGPWGGPLPRRTLVMSFVSFFTRLPAGPDFSFVSHHITNGYCLYSFPSLRRVMMMLSRGRHVSLSFANV